METLLIVLVPGIVGGLALALVLAARWKRIPSIVVPRRLEAPSSALINMAHIKVEGVGGLGLVAAVVAVAIADSRIGLATVLAVISGAGLALALIVRRRQTGALPSGGNGPDDRSILHLENDPRASHLESNETTVGIPPRSAAGNPRKERAAVHDFVEDFHAVTGRTPSRAV
jgi:hypothetical protein